nr:hypothetical protein Itr_chr02CG25170 [Ipomoea trifida]
MILWKQCSISFSIFSASDPRFKGLNVTVSSTCLRNSSNHGLEFSRAVVSGSSAGRFKSRDGFEAQWARFVISGMPKPKRSSFSTVPMVFLLFRRIGLRVEELELGLVSIPRSTPIWI